MKRFILALGLLAGTAAGASAATISSVTAFILPGFSTGSVGPVGLTPSPNNDNTAAASPNVIPSSIFFNDFGAAETEFGLTDSGGTTEYRFTQTAVNNTGQPWIGFRFELGFGTGANFVSSGVLDVLDFDWPDMDPAPTSSAFPLLNHQPDTLDWSGATVPSVGGVQFTFAVDVPDGLAGVNPHGFNRFTIRQTPIAAAVPEPGMLLLLGAGVAGVLARYRRH